MIKSFKYWKCTVTQCKGRLTTTNNTIKKERSEHNHNPNLCKLKVKKIAVRMKSKALTLQDNPQ